MATTATTTKQRIISADSHVTITDEAFLEHVSAKHRAAAENVINEAHAARPSIQMPDNRSHHDWPAQGRPGERNQEDRVQDQLTDGIEAEVLYSQSTFGFDCGLFYKLPDAASRIACFQAYNDSLADWIRSAPDRFVPVGIIPVADADEGIAELERLVGLGFRAATLPSYPEAHGLAAYWEDRYDRLWQAFATNSIPLSLHTNITPGLQPTLAADPTPAKGIALSLPPMHMAELVGTWILGGMVPKNPDLQVVLVESGIGWIAYYLERLDTMSRRHNWANRGMIKELPSTFWRRQFHATFEDDLAGMRTMDMLGVETLMFATDYPHPDSTWPESQQVVEQHFEGLSDDDKQKVVWKNAAALYRL